MKTKKTLSIYLTLLASVILFALSINQLVRACAGEYWDWKTNPQVFMQPNLESGQKRFEAFYYTTDFLNGSKEDEAMPSEEELINTDENTQLWFNQFQQKISKRSIYHFLYQSAPYHSEEIINTTHFLNYYAHDTFVQYLKKNKAALNYFIIAKLNEFGYDELDNGWNEFNSWDAYGTDNLPEQQVNPTLSKIIEQKLQATKNPFYKQRYAFQLIRNYRYTYQSDKVDTLYQTYFSSSPQSTLKLAALNYATDALVNANQQTKANYYAALLFDASEEKQYRAYNNLSSRIDISTVLDYCKNNQEKAMVYALYAFKDFYINAAYIKQAVAFNPNNKSINDLLIRELNKMDYQLMPDVNTLYNTPVSDMIEKDPEPGIYDEEGNVIRTYPSTEINTPILVRLLQDLKNSNTTQQPFYTLCLAHISLINNEYELAKTYLNQINPKKLEPKLALQHQITSTILHIKSTNLRLPQNQTLLTSFIKYIDQHQEEIYYNEFIPNGIRVLACAKLIKDKDFAHAYLLAESIETIYDSYSMIEQQIRPRDIDTILAIRKNPKSEFEKFITTKNKLDEAKLYNIQGAKYLREQNLVMANASFKKSDSQFIPINFAKLNTNPDGHPCYPYMYSPIPQAEEQYYTAEEVVKHNQRAALYQWNFNHYSITQTMLNLKKQITAKQGNIAEHYYNLACLYMEISWYGRAYTAMQFNESWSWYETEYPGEVKGFGLHYYGNAWAIPYYKLALQHSKNRELSAKCLYALFRCNRHLMHFTNDSKTETDLSYLYKLHDEFANTEYYKIKECWGLSAYVSELRQSNTLPN